MPNSNNAIQAAFSLAGKLAIVTGAGSGLAEAIAKTLALAGASIIVAHDDCQQAERVAKEISDSGGAARAMGFIPEDEVSICNLFGAMNDRDEVADIVVLGAMMQGGVPALEMTSKQWDSMFAVNTRGAFLTAREAIRTMKAAGKPGRIIALSTMGAAHPVLIGNSAYGASKAALNQLCRTLAYEHAGDQILVNAIMPGAIPGNAPKMAGAEFHGGPGAQAERHLLGYGNPADVGWLAVYLAGPSGGYVTGQTITIDGGFSVG